MAIAASWQTNIAATFEGFSPNERSTPTSRPHFEKVFTAKKAMVIMPQQANSPPAASSTILSDSSQSMESVSISLKYEFSTKPFSNR